MTSAPDSFSPPPLSADPSRQAVSALTGYSYQIWRTLAAWFELGPGEDLFIERAEDFDVLKEGAGTTVQVKNLTRNVTLASHDVAEAIFHFWEHRYRNPGRDIQFHFLTTAGRGEERKNAFDGRKGLDVWDACRSPDTDLRPLRAFLGEIDWPVTGTPADRAERDALAKGLTDFVKSASDDELRGLLIQRIHWDTGSELLAGVEQMVGRYAVAHGARFHDLPPFESARIVSHLLQHIWEVACTPSERRLTYSDLLRVFEAETTAQVSHAELREIERMRREAVLAARTRPAPAVAGLLSAQHLDVRRYLDHLVVTLRERNRTWSAGTFEPFVDPAAEQRMDPSPPRRDYPRQLGKVLAFPQIRPAIAEVAGAAGPLESITSASDVVGVQTRSVRNVLHELRSHRHPLVLLGEPGSGKSTTLRELAIRLAQHALKSRHAPIPVYVELGTFRDRLGPNPNETIIELIRKAVPPEMSGLHQSLGSGDLRIVVLFDAMDEMPRFDDYTERTAALAEFASTSVARTVFACRTNDFDPNFGHRQLVLKPFDEPRIRQFVRETLGGHFQVDGEAQTPKSAARRLLRVDELGAEAGNPLTLSLAVEFIAQWRRWPRGRAALFENHLAAMADKAFRRKGTTPPDEQLRLVVDEWSGLAYEIFRHGGAVFIVRKLLEERVGEAPVELAISGGLVVEDAASGLLKFRHHRLQEFLVARRLRLPDPPRPDWSTVLVSPRWQETLLNYFAIGGQDAEAIDVILGTLGPAERYFNRLRPIAERSNRMIAAAQRAHEAIKPDERRGGLKAYSDYQRARKNEAEERLEQLRGRHKRLTTLPPDRETTWSDHVLFAGRLCPLLSPPTREKDLRQPLRLALTGLLDFGRPASQVRMLSTWREISDWCPASLLDPVRNSPLEWVRLQAIHALISTPLRRGRVDHAFSEELEWEMLNLRLPAAAPLFWETAALRPHRRLQVVLAALIHLIFVLVVLAAVAGTGTQVVPRLGRFVPAFAGTAPALLWLGWAGVIGVAAVLTVPILRRPPFVRVAAANAIIGGIAVGVMTVIAMVAAVIRGAPLDVLDPMRVLTSAVAPAFITSGVLLILFPGARFVFRATLGSTDLEPRPSRRIRTTAGFDFAARMGRHACFITVAGAILIFLGSPASQPLFDLLAVFVRVSIGGACAIAICLVLHHFWQDTAGRRVPVRIALVLRNVVVSVVGIAVALGAVLGLVVVADNVLQGLIPESLDALSRKIVLGIFGLCVGLVLLLLIVLYVSYAFGHTLAEIRYRLLRRRFRQRPFTGNLLQWEATFRGASGFKRRDLVETFDHRAMGVAPEDVLRTLHDLEGLVDLDAPAAEVFHQTMYRMQEAVRQQRWADPGVLPATGNAD
jgi:NACHT domain